MACAGSHSRSRRQGVWVCLCSDAIWTDYIKPQKCLIFSQMSLSCVYTEGPWMSAWANKDGEKKLWESFKSPSSTSLDCGLVIKLYTGWERRVLLPPVLAVDAADWKSLGARRRENFRSALQEPLASFPGTGQTECRGHWLAKRCSCEQAGISYAALGPYR